MTATIARTKHRTISEAAFERMQAGEEVAFELLSAVKHDPRYRDLFRDPADPVITALNDWARLARAAVKGGE